jgi:hypothetical protein
MSNQTETYSIMYVYPCLACGEDTGSDHDLPTTCIECSGHECERHWLSDNPKIVFCGICDRDWNLA